MFNIDHPLLAPSNTEGSESKGAHFRLCIPFDCACECVHEYVCGVPNILEADALTGAQVQGLPVSQFLLQWVARSEEGDDG